MKISQIFFSPEKNVLLKLQCAPLSLVFRFLMDKPS